MSNQRTTFLKRQREADRKDKAKAKQERLAAARSGTKPTTKGPQIAWDEQVFPIDSALPGDPTTTDTTTDDTATTDAKPTDE